MRADLTTTYLGRELKNPIVASSSPLTGDLDTLSRLEQVGVAAAVLPSLFEEQITHDRQRVRQLNDYQGFNSAESLSYFPKSREYRMGPREYLSLIAEAKKRVSIPIIGSLNGCTPSGWARYAKLFEESGTDAIELNVYFLPTDPEMSSDAVERRYLNLVALVRNVVSIPIAVKLGPQFSNLTNLVPRLGDAGASGVVLFNRYLEPDVDLEALRITPQLVLSNRHELRLPLRWISILCDQVDMSLAATSGIHFPEDVIKLLLVGADVCMIASAFLKHGVDFAADLIEQVRYWLDVKGYKSVEQIKGSMSYGNCTDAGNLERANYMKSIVSYTADP